MTETTNDNTRKPRRFLERLTSTRARRLSLAAAFAVIVVGTLLLVFSSRTTDYEITDQLGGNIFPSAIISVATSDADILQPVDSPYVGSPKAPFAVTVTSGRPNSVVRIELAETPFYARSVSTFILPEPKTTYVVYPDILWDYDALRGNQQAEPINVVATVTLNGKDLGQHTRTFSVRSINECLLGYTATRRDGTTRFVSTRLFFAAYVNEENPMIDKVLREALDTRIVRRFLGYQSGKAENVDKQVYAIWHVLQKRNFKYSSVSYSSLSSNMVFAQRVRTFEDAIGSSQINCVDGSVLFASLLRAINITPVLIQIPGHMFVGYYTDDKHSGLTFLETTMIGDVDLDDYFPEEKLDSTMQGRTQAEMSKLTFEKSKEYATREYNKNEAAIKGNQKGYMFVEISKNVRRHVQSIGR